MKEKFKAEPEAKGQRLDLYLAKRYSELWSRTAIKEMILAKEILVNQRVVKPHTLIQAGDEIEVEGGLPKKAEARAESIPLDIVYEDRDLLVVNKPAGMVVHPACGNYEHTLVNALLYHTNQSLPETENPLRPGIVHRLDKETSGLLVVAKNEKVHRDLGNQFRAHRVTRIYQAVVKGVVQHEEMKCDVSLGRSVLDRRKVTVLPAGGRHAVTYFRVMERFVKATLVEARPRTGRTHQIRIHLAHLGYPVLGDRTYGVLSPLIDRQALHAQTLGFRHPSSKEFLTFTLPLPEDMRTLIKNLRGEK